MAGARDYRPGDSPRRIHWPATARAGSLQSRVYEATTDRRIELALNLVTNEALWWSQVYDPDVLELTISTAATIADWALDAGYLVGLASNGMYRGSWESVAVQAARDPDQLERILLALGTLRPYAVAALRGAPGRPQPPAALRDDARRRHRRRWTIARRGDPSGGRSRARRLHRVHRAGNAPSAALPGYEIRRVGPPELWREGL